MATYYWVGGTGSWSNSNTRNWATTSGGVGGEGVNVPTLADDVVFDANSDTGGPFTVTVEGTSAADPKICKTFSTGGSGGALDQIMTLAGAGRICVFGDVTFPAVNFVSTYTGTLTIQDTATLTTNGIAVAALTVGGVGSATNPIPTPNFSLVLTLGSAYTSTAGGGISLNAGTLDTNNFNVTVASISSIVAYTRTLNLGSSVVTLTATNPFPIANFVGYLTINAGTSTINISAAGPTFPSPTFSGAGFTFNNVSFTSTAKTNVTISGSNTFNNLTIVTNTSSLNYNIFFVSGTTQTITGTLTLPTPAAANNRCTVRGITFRVIATLNVAAVNAFTDVDFRDIAITGAAAPVSGARLGNAQNNSGITFPAGVNKYWSLAAGGNWTATAWALTSGGAPAIANQPLAQDTVIIDDAGLNSGATVTFNLSPFVGSLTTASRTLPMTIALGSGAPGFYGNITLSSAVTLTTIATGALGVGSGYGITQTLTSAGVAWPRGFSISPVSGTFVFADAATVTGSILCQLGSAGQNQTGTVKFKDGATYTATAFSFQSANTNMITISSTTPGSQYTLSAPTQLGSASFTTIIDSIATGGAAWLAPLNLGNIDGGNNTGWQFIGGASIAGKIAGLSFGFKL